MGTLSRLALGLSLAACQSTPLPPTGAPSVADLAFFSAFDPADYPGAGSVLTGFAAPDGTRDLREGDAVLFGLEVDDGESMVRRMVRLEVRSLLPASFRIDAETRTLTYVRGVQRATWSSRRRQIGGDGAEVVEEFEVELTPLELELSLFDAEGVELSRSTAVLYDELLSRGLWPIACSEPTREDGVMPMLLLLTLQRLGADDEVLHDLLFTVVEKPSFLSVIANLGVSVLLSSRPGGPGPRLALDELDVETRVLPIDLDVNGARALQVHLVCADPTGSFATAGGIVGAIARHPSASGTARLRILATRRAEASGRIRWTAGNGPGIGGPEPAARTGDSRPR